MYKSNGAIVEYDVEERLSYWVEEILRLSPLRFLYISRSRLACNRCVSGSHEFSDELYPFHLIRKRSFFCFLSYR